MSELTDVERAKESLREAVTDRCKYSGLWIDINLLLDSHDRLTRELREAQEDVARHKRFHRQPTHGRCCTCQHCGQFYDDCRCSLDDVADELDKAQAEVSDLRAKLAAERAEREKQDEWVIGPAEAKIAALETQLVELQRHRHRDVRSFVQPEGLLKPLVRPADELEKAEAALAAERERRERMERAGEALFAHAHHGFNRCTHDTCRCGLNEAQAQWAEALRPAAQEPQPRE